jgi:hypothetical protein
MLTLGSTRRPPGARKTATDTWFDEDEASAARGKGDEGSGG